jgi:hypothetical protein
MVQENVTFALAIPHTPWVPARVESHERLRRALAVNVPSGGVVTRDFTDRAANYVWSEQMWKWAVETKATHFLQLQDDVLVAPNFWQALCAMVSAIPDKIVGLESVHPRSQSIPGHWYTTSEGLIGVGYVLPMTALRSFLKWRSSMLCKGAIESITEDTLLCLWALVTGQRVWHPVPTIIDHDIEIASTYGNDHHTHRRPLVTWKDAGAPETAEAWSPRNVEHVGQFYGGTVARLARRWIIGATDEYWEEWKKC